MPDIDVDMHSVPPCQKSSPWAIMPSIPLLLGENPLLLSPTQRGQSMVTNFRLFAAEHRSVLSVPLLSISELISMEAQLTIRLGCKDGATYCCTFGSLTDLRSCYSMLSDLVASPPRRMQDIFAFRFSAAALQRDHPSSMTEAEQMSLFKPVNPAFAYSFDKEIDRLGFKTRGDKAPWKMSRDNEEFEYCQTYPKYHLIPKSVSAEILKASLDFRALKRFPSVVWRDKSSGMVLIRSSQPLSSILGVSYFRNDADLFLLDEIVKACNREFKDIEIRRQSHIATLPENDTDYNTVYTVENGVNKEEDGAQGGLVAQGVGAAAVSQTPRHESDCPQKLAIVDCRSTAGVWGNSFKGGGTEDEILYKCKLIHLDIANIHAVRDSFKKLRELSYNYSEGTYMKTLAGSQWLQYISCLLRGANIVVELIKSKRRPVLVHCSDGWDRTAQICSLSELLMDPYYRTIEGFQVLVEREWLHFGHKFGERGGHDPKCSDSNQNSPIFLQFLDCVYQLTLQYPLEFQFNEAFLIKLLKHSQSCLFGTFLHNCTRERENCKQKLASVWVLFQSHNVRYRNLLFKPRQETLIARFGEHDVDVWKSVYMAGHTVLTSHTELCIDGSLASDGNPAAEPLHRTRSMEQLHKTADGRSRRNSDPTLESGASTDQQEVRSDQQQTTVDQQEASSGASADDNEMFIKTAHGKTDAGKEFEGQNFSSGDIKKSIDTEKSVVNRNSEKPSEKSPPLSITMETSDNSAQSGETLTFDSKFESDILKNNLSENHKENVSHKDQDLSVISENCSSLLSERLAVSQLHFQDDRMQHSLDSADLSKKLDSSQHSNKTMSKSLTEDGFKQPFCDYLPMRVTSSEANLGSMKIPPFQKIRTDSNMTLVSKDIASPIVDAQSNGNSTLNGEEGQQTNDHSSSSSACSSTTICSTKMMNHPSSENLISISPPTNGVSPKKDHGVSESPEGSTGSKLLSRRARAASGASRDLSLSPNTGNGNWTDTGRLRHASGNDSALKRCISTAVSTSTTDISDSSVSTVLMPTKERYPPIHRQLIDVDGLTLTYDPRQELLSELIHDKDEKLKDLQATVDMYKKMLQRQKSHYLAVEDMPSDSEGGEPSSLGALSNQSGESWEALEETEAKMVAWVPDHVVTHCASCDSPFWIGRWKHHCRNCGKVFCDECTSYRAPVPHAHLNKPERVCQRCHTSLMQLSPGASSDGRIPTLVADG